MLLLPKTRMGKKFLDGQSLDPYPAVFLRMHVDRLWQLDAFIWF